VAVKRAESGDYLVLVLRGDFRGGGESFAELRRAGHEALAANPFLALDLARVAFLDSQTLGLLVELLRSAQARGGTLVLFNVGPRVRRWFELSGLDRIFELLDEGMTPASLRPAPPPDSRRRLLDSVDVERLVSELSSALGEAGPDGAPAAPGPAEQRMLTEIDRLLSSSGGEAS
jgi:anti-sigma B factor antagonist